MQREHLTDIDSLLILVQNSNSKRYISESIDAFRVGSYRASILCAWVALNYDLIEKIRDIAISGEQQAIDFIADFNKYVELNNLEKLLRTEKEILETAKTFEIITTREHYELEKLRQDRHLCAHPAFSNEENLFEPSPEQVRFNIVNVLNFVLTQKPVQGKKAVENLHQFINSSTFPDDYSDLKKIIQMRFLVRSKKSFVSNSIKLMLKNLIMQDWKPQDQEFRDRYLSTLKAFTDLENDETKKIYKHCIHQYLGTNNEKYYINFFSILSIDHFFWNLLSVQEQTTIDSIIKKINSAYSFKYLISCIDYTLIGATISDKLRSLDSRVILEISEQQIKVLKDILIEQMMTQPSFTKTRDFGQKLAGSYSKYLTKADLQKILEFAKNESQFHGYANSDQILKDLYRNTKSRFAESLKNDWVATIECGCLNEFKNFLITEGVIEEK